MKKGWFEMPGVQRGDRTLEQQLTGLDPLFAEIRALAAARPPGSANEVSVLDLGCAEGLIARACVEAGAGQVLGMDILPASIERAWSLGINPDRAGFCVHDLHECPVPTTATRDPVDIILMLAIAHKMRDPARFLREWGRLTNSLIVLRLPPATAPVIVDRRSGNKPFDSAQILAELGFALERVTRGHLDEWVGYFRRHH